MSLGEARERGEGREERADRLSFRFDQSTEKSLSSGSELQSLLRFSMICGESTISRTWIRGWLVLPVSFSSFRSRLVLTLLEPPVHLLEHQATLPRLPTRLSTQLRNILQHFSLLSGRDLPVILARQNVDGSEIDFANMLTEDANNGELSYPDYLMIVHKQITASLSARFFSLAFDASLLLSSVSQS